jgi:hypothetical protein
VNEPNPTRSRYELPAHRWDDTAHAILQATVDEDLPDLERAVQALTQSAEKEGPDMCRSLTLEPITLTPALTCRV